MSEVHPKKTDHPDGPLVVDDCDTITAIINEARFSDRKIGLVPTMGALHEGHLSLVRRSRLQCDVTAVTIFVNPTQFGPDEDYQRYPRTWEQDLAALGAEKVDLVFAPRPETLYPEDFSTYVEPPDVARSLEGRFRPGHFRGVATIVLKLFHLLPADVAYFGQKDYQQVRVVEQMVRDLNVPIHIEVCPIVREPDGLAMSSRNRYMSDRERRCALGLSRSLNRAGEMAGQGIREASQILEEMRRLLEEAGVTRIDYVALVEPRGLAPVEEVTAETMALVAAYVGNTRLIDNRRIG